MNPYDVLEIKPGASFEEIKASYHRLAKQWHPDHFSGEEKLKAEERFRQLAEAFNALKDVASRIETQGAAASSSTPPKPAPQNTPEKVVPEQAKPLEKTAAEWLASAKEAMEVKDFAKALGLVHYALRLDGELAEAHALLGYLIDMTVGDQRAKIKALENAIRLNPQDVNSMLYLSEAYQSQGLHARAARIREGAQQIAPKHPYFQKESKSKSMPKESVKKEVPQGIGEQLSALLGRFFKKG